MEPLSSRPQRGIRAAILLITLAISAYFLAQGTTGALAHRLFAALEGAPVQQSAGSMPSLTREQKTISAIVSRNIFGPDVLLSERPDDVATGGQPGEGGIEGDEELLEEYDDDGFIPRCDGTSRLVAAVVHPTNPMSSVAALADTSGQTRLYREGMSFDGREIVAIAPHRVILRPSGGRYCQLPMFNTEIGTVAPARPQPATANRAATATRATTTNDRNAGLTNDEMAQGIQKHSDTSYSINRDIFDRILASPETISGLARAIPHEENGRVVGSRLYGIRRNALLGRLGVQNGDMLRTINGFEIASLDQDTDAALNALTTIRGSNQLTVSVIRRGQPVTLEYTVK